jgi:hypothetical protein
LLHHAIQVLWLAEVCFTIQSHQELSMSRHRSIPSKPKVMLKTPIFKKSHISDALAGIVTVFAIDTVVVFIALLLNIVSPVFISVVFAIGLVQLIYVLPLLQWSIKRRIKGFSKGLLLGSLAIATINFACFLVTFKFFSSGGR